LALPPFLDRLLDDPRFASCRSLRRVFCGSDRMPAALCRRFLETGLDAELYNIYGMTEALYASYWRCRSVPESGSVPIGFSANARLYLLDDKYQPQRAGEAGEIWVGGACVASGYWNRPRLTAERFLPDPFGEGEGSRLFRTGDLGRMLPDGAIEYLGRLDDRVKIRGSRVEPGEVTAALYRLPGVRQAVVVAREYRPGDLRLVAYVVPSERRSAAATPHAGRLEADLRARLQAELPEPLVPSSFVVLDSLPLAAGGKVDRGALPAPAAEDQGPAGSSEAPRNPLEKELAAVWSRLLTCERIGVRDDFFKLGGDSLLALRLLTHIRELYKVELSLGDIVGAPTLAGLAEKLGEHVLTGRAAPFALESASPPRTRADRIPDPTAAADPPPKASWFRRTYRFMGLSNHPFARGVRALAAGLKSLSLPAPRPVFLPLVAVYVATRSVYYWMMRMLICEPFFKTYCKRYGRRLHTGVYIHWVRGMGDILVGDDVVIDGKCSFTFAARFSEHPTLEIGDRTRISHGCSFVIGKKITIGRSCGLAAGVSLLDSSGHSPDPAARRDGMRLEAAAVRPIEIGDYVWIGKGSAVLPGVKIGEGSVVSAFSVVMSDVPPYTVVAGNPARVVAEFRSPSGSSP
jgi:acetyltransferase-like isoleucine patch superfamily enzyme